MVEIVGLDSRLGVTSPWSLAVGTVYRTVPLCRSSFEPHIPTKQNAAPMGRRSTLVEIVGLEPMTYALRTHRSTI